MVRCRIFSNFAPDIVTAVGTKLPEDVATNVNILNINIYNGFNQGCRRSICKRQGTSEFGPGDTITVAYRIKEGNKERIQQYRGVVIRISGEGKKKRFTVRKMSDNIGVERIFPIESPFIDSITINKYGKVRRAKLYYLRALTGKKARIKERRVAK